MPTAGLRTIIALSFVLAVGFLLVILSCALWSNYHPLLVVATYVIAPIPNWIASRCSNPDDFGEGSGGAAADLGRFCTAFLVVMGIGMFYDSSGRHAHWCPLRASMDCLTLRFLRSLRGTFR